MVLHRPVELAPFLGTWPPERFRLYLPSRQMRCVQCRGRVRCAIAMKGLKEFFGNLFTAGKRAGVDRPDLRDTGSAERPRPAPPSLEMAARHEQSAPEAAYKKGDVIGNKYEIHRLLDRGGFGEVYLVYSRELREARALKTFRQKVLADAEVKANFKREALLWVNLEEHPFILAARFVEEFYGRLFVAMDYIAPDDRGRVTLAHHLAYARVPLETSQALEWAIMFCHGMEHANQRGIKCLIPLATSAA